VRSDLTEGVSDYIHKGGGKVFVWKRKDSGQARNHKNLVQNPGMHYPKISTQQREEMGGRGVGKDSSSYEGGDYFWSAEIS